MQQYAEEADEADEGIGSGDVLSASDSCIEGRSKEEARRRM